MSRLFSIVALVGVTILVIGCGNSGSLPQGYTDKSETADFDADDAAASNDVPPDSSAQLDNDASASNKADEVKRQIIRNAEMEVEVEDFSDLPASIAQAIESHDGYIATSNVVGSPGEARTGSWTIRVPADRFEKLLDELQKLGEIRRRHTNSREVTAEYYDVAARVRNKQQEESRLLKHLEGSTGRLDDILTVEREITRVRGELERYQGRMEMLEDLTAMSTITLTVREIGTFTPAEAPTFGVRVSRTFEATVETMLAVGQAVTLFLVAVGPWLLVLGLPTALLAVVVRRLARRRIAVS